MPDKYTPSLCEECGKQFMARTRAQRIGLGRFCSLSCFATSNARTHPMTRESHPQWRGGTSHNKGYPTVLLAPDDPFYPMANPNGYIYEHRLVMARHLGRVLKPEEVIHHRNGNKTDNDIANLMLTDPFTHSQLHADAIKKKWARHYDRCVSCGSNQKKHTGLGICNGCRCRAENAKRKLAKRSG